MWLEVDQGVFIRPSLESKWIAPQTKLRWPYSHTSCNFISIDYLQQIPVCQKCLLHQIFASLHNFLQRGPSLHCPWPLGLILTLQQHSASWVLAQEPLTIGCLWYPLSQWWSFFSAPCSNYILGWVLPRQRHPLLESESDGLMLQKRIDIHTNCDS